MLSRKDLIQINQEFHTGKVANLSSLEYALDQAQRSRDWLKAAAVLARAMLIDHVFEDGNKRTAAAVITLYIDVQNCSFDQQKVDDLVIQIAKKNIQDIRRITRLIKNVLQ